MAGEDYKRFANKESVRNFDREEGTVSLRKRNDITHINTNPRNWKDWNETKHYFPKMKFTFSQSSEALHKTNKL